MKNILKKYAGKITSIQAEGGLVDDCKYMVYFVDHSIFGSCYPVQTLKEIHSLMEDY